MKRLRLLPIAMVPALVLGLAACSGSGSGGSTPTPSASPSTTATATPITSCPEPGKASDSVRVSGAFGTDEAPKVSFDKGLTVSPPQGTVVVKGKGGALKTGDYVTLSLSVYDAKSASKIGSVGFESGKPQLYSVGGTGFGAALTCDRVGDRIVLVGDSTELGLNTGGDNVVVADVLSKVPTKADGTPQKQDPSLPTVQDKADGEPEITIPDGMKTPSKTQVEVIKQGDGTAIKEGDTALVQYKGALLDGGKVFDSSWSRGQIQPFTIAEGQLIKGFVTGLVGQKVGSQVLIVTTPEDAYGSSPREGSGIPKNAPLVFVVDILAVG